ncbi:MAG: ankyrin repeat domain-containing protein [Candidatus Micrarchaeota archaeon]
MEERDIQKELFNLADKGDAPSVKKAKRIIEQAKLHPDKFRHALTNNTLFLHACSKGNRNFAELLREKGADPNETNNQERDGLILAILNRHFEYANHLLNEVPNLDLTKRDKFNKSAFKYVEEHLSKLEKDKARIKAKVKPSVSMIRKISSFEKEGISELDRIEQEEALLKSLSKKLE